MVSAGQAPGEWAQGYHCGGSGAAGLGLRVAGTAGAGLPDSTCSSVEQGRRGMGKA